MTSNLVSIIIPCFRQGHLLANAIETALAQTHPHLQIIVVNDGSADNTADIAARYGNRILYLEQDNQGLCAARNTGIKAAAGRYLHFLDADDLLHPSAIEWLVACMDNHDDRLALMGFRFFSDEPYSEAGDDLLPASGAAWFVKTFEIDPLLIKWPEKLDPDRLEALPYSLYTNFGPPHCFMSSRKMVLEMGGFDESLCGYGDWDLWLRLVLTGAELATTPHTGALYRRYPGSMSGDDAQMLDDRVRLLLKAIGSMRVQPEHLEKWGQDLLQAARRVRRRYFAYGITSKYIKELSREIRMLQQFDKLPRRRLTELTLGATWDRIALGYYSFARPALIGYYRYGND